MVLRQHSGSTFLSCSISLHLKRSMGDCWREAVETAGPFSAVSLKQLTAGSWTEAGETTGPFLAVSVNSWRLLNRGMGDWNRPRHLVLAVSSKIKVMCHSCIFIVFLIQCIRSHLQHIIIECMRGVYVFIKHSSLIGYSQTGRNQARLYTSLVIPLSRVYRAFQVACNLQKRSRDQTDQSAGLIAWVWSHDCSCIGIAHCKQPEKRGMSSLCHVVVANQALHEDTKVRGPGVEAIL